MISFRKFFTEAATEGEMMTPDQNSTLKEIYNMVKILIDEFIAYRQRIPDAKARDVARALNLEDRGLFISKDGTSFHFSPENIRRWQQVYPNMDTNFNINLYPGQTGRAQIVFDSGTDHFDRIRLNPKHMIPGNETRIKASLQHELEHFNKKAETSDVEGVAKSVMYMADEGEVRSHAKEAAYYTYKMLPGVTTFDYNKLLTAGVKEEDLHKYHIYAVKFLDDTWRNDLITKHNLNPGISQTMIDAGNKFLSYVQRYLAHSFKVAQQQGINQQDQPTHGAATPSLIAQHKAQLPQAPQAPLDTGSSI